MKKNIAIVTGGSSGLGKEFVRLLLDEDCIDELWVIARDFEKLKTLKDELGEKVIVFSSDLSDFKQVMSFENIIMERNVLIKILINNAGFGKFAPIYDISIEEWINMMQLNMGAMVALSYICIPFMDKGSHILNISSQSSFTPVPYYNIYGSTKVFLRHFSRALAVELKDKGISVTVTCPPWMDTNFFARAKTKARKGPNNFVGMANPSKVAAKTLKDTIEKRPLSIYGPHSKLSHIAGKILPQSLMMNIWLKQQGLL